MSIALLHTRLTTLTRGTATPDMTVDDPSNTPAPLSYDASDAGSRSRLAVPPGQGAYASQPSAPARRAFFDPWNSSSTGHQRAENRLSGSTSWRASRNLKLGEQFKGGRYGGKRITDTVGAGSDDSANVGLHSLRTGGQKSLAEVWTAGKSCTQPSKYKGNIYTLSCYRYTMYLSLICTQSQRQTQSLNQIHTPRATFVKIVRCLRTNSCSRASASISMARLPPLSQITS